MRSILLVTPVWRRFELTRIMLTHRVKTFLEAEALGVRCGCVVIGDDENLATAVSLGFHAIEAPNVLGSKYNDGHELAVTAGWDFSFQVNSDQVFDPRLLAAIVQSPHDMLIETQWLTAVHRGGGKAISYKNPIWAMKAYPTHLLKNVPRPCDELAMSMCDTSVHNGVAAANPDAGTHIVEIGPLETVQFESGNQMTPWKRHLYAGMMSSTLECPVPWEGLAEIHGEDLVLEMREFYGQ